MREKEHEGHGVCDRTPDVGGADSVPDSGGAAGVTDTGEADGEPAPDEDTFTLPDEDTFTLPDTWRGSLRPRWGGVARYVHQPHAAALDSWDRRLTAVREAWAAPDPDRPAPDHGTTVTPYIDGPTPDLAPELAAAARAYLAGTPDPVGAAVLAVLTDRGRLVYGEVADAWWLRHGCVFAARAAVELCALDRVEDQGRTTRLDVAPPADGPGRLWLHRGAADRVRALLAGAEEGTYREVVAALAAHRGDARRRVVVSYLVPGETEWTAECCADPGESGRENRVVRAMLFESLHAAEQLRTLLREGGVPAYDGTLATTATVAEGVGTAVVELLAATWRHRTPSDGAAAEEQAAILAELPTDEAFELLLTHADDKHVRPALLAAAARYPVRAARLLAGRAAPAPGRNAFLLGQLLTAHVATHAGLLESRAAGFPPKAAAVIRELLHPSVVEASEDALPELLARPPWTTDRTAPKQRTVKGLAAGEETVVRWQPGEREEWAAVGERERRGQQPPPDVDTLRERFTDLDNYRLAELFAAGPESYRPLLARWTPEHMADVAGNLKPVAARWEEAALPSLLHAVERQPAEAGELLVPYGQVAVARLMADWFVRLKSVAATARAWFARHGAAGATLLVPDAAGPAGPARRNAEHALRAVAAAHGDAVVLEAAAAHGEQAVAVVRDLLSPDHLELALPAKMPEPATWADPRLLPRVPLRDRSAVLPPSAVRHLLTMLAISRPGAVYTGVRTVKEACDPAALADFAWSLFEQWRLAGMSPEGSWTLHALGWLGDDGTVRRLAPVLRKWPGEGAHRRAVEGLDVLVALGSDAALAQLHGLSRRVRYKALRTRAEEKTAQVAAELGLSGEELADRLVPDFGLAADGTTVLDYGPRRFTVGFDEQLRPYVLDETGKRRKDLPKPGTHDDPEEAPAARKRFLALKKDVRAVAADQVRRLEHAMLTGRTWTPAQFRELFVTHPLLWHLVRHLVWLSVPPGAHEHTLYEPPAANGTGADGPVPFRVTEEREPTARAFTDVRGEEITPPPGALIRLAHPLHLGGELPQWQALFGTSASPQPFPQVDRAVHRLTPEEAASGHLARFENAVVPTGSLLGLERRGWERDEPMFAGLQVQMSKRVAKNRWLTVTPSEGFFLGAVDAATEQTLEYVALADTPSAWEPRVESATPTFAELDPVTVSELLADLTELVKR